MSFSAPKRRKFNHKRRLHKGLDTARANSIADSIVYKGSPLHKRIPGDFGLTPPSSPRPGKTLCDGVEIFQVQIANQLLQNGAKKGMVSEDAEQGFPRYVWSVTDNEDVLEARCDDVIQGTYHGYPLENNDPMATIVKKRWRELSDVR